MLEITSPTGVTKLVKAETEADKAYYMKWVERGYIVKELKISTVPESRCISCEG